MDRYQSEELSCHNHMDASYQFTLLPELQGLLDQVDTLKQTIATKRPIAPALWETIQKKLYLIWTHHTNAIEGGTLTLGETSYFLEYGLTVEGKPLKDFLDARNHAQAIGFLNEVIQAERPISEGLIKSFNSLLLHGLESTEALNQFGQRVHKPVAPGQYKTQPNHVLQPDGTIHSYVAPLQVQPQMQALVEWIHATGTPDHPEAQQHPTIVAAIAHYNMVRIHPFDDGNGRGARLLMNLILMQHDYPPAVIKNEQRRPYIETLVAADQGDLNPFIAFVIQSLIDTEKTILADLD